ncbi:MAG: flagellar basal-body rod protein FlgF [endosymbiont of Galathealinum brachiosum]|uniref:Flagellar basal-body rod protein FlgF n=1 Tax=endosymbiont of Galathealinum brachiosum TaxID=2200906 RepID=A0A370DIK1_9GAMM|nr:MAG: flagellar basal-body rod protein FlgF [endosymbiont of Galathealinum brachiosum]
MDKMLYTAMNSARQAMQAQTAISHNLSNANTTGFKSHFNTFTSWHVSGPGYNTRVMAQQNADDIDIKPGSLSTTDRELDVAINGEGFIAVQTPSGGEAYTRAGDLRLDSNGLLTTGTGFAVLGNGGPIALPPAEKIEIGTDGSISILPVGQSAESLVIADKIKLVNPDVKSLYKDADGLLLTRGGGEEPAAVDVKLEKGVLELSNVNAVGQMIQLISNARQFETGIKLMQEAKTLDESSAQLLRNS